MKLYYTPGACSLSDRIALHEAGIDVTFEKVDLKTKKTETGADFLVINPMGYVPALILDDGEMITENIAVHFWIAEQTPALSPPGVLGRTRLLEALSFIAEELHMKFKPFFHNGSDADKESAAEVISKRLSFLAEKADAPYLFGSQFTGADAYLFVVLMWARRFDITIPERLHHFSKNVMARESVRTALAEEGLN